MSFEEKKQTFESDIELSYIRRKLREIEDQLESLQEHKWEYTNAMVKLDEALLWIEKLYAEAVNAQS